MIKRAHLRCFRFRKDAWTRHLLDWSGCGLARACCSTIRDWLRGSSIFRSLLLPSLFYVGHLVFNLHKRPSVTKTDRSSSLPGMYGGQGYTSEPNQYTICTPLSRAGENDIQVFCGSFHIFLGIVKRSRCQPDNIRFPVVADDSPFLQANKRSVHHTAPLRQKQKRQLGTSRLGVGRSDDGETRIIPPQRLLRGHKEFRPVEKALELACEHFRSLAKRAHHPCLLESL